MSFNNAIYMNAKSYPWTNLDNINLDWFINEMQNVLKKFGYYEEDYKNLREWLVLELDKMSREITERTGEDVIEPIVERWLEQHPESKIPDNSVTASKLAENAVENKHISYGAVSYRNLSQDLKDDLAEIRSDIPTKVSELENDSKYITKDDIPTKLSEYENDTKFIQKETIIDEVKPINVLNPDECIIGKLINIRSDGKNAGYMENARYYISGFIPVEDGDIVRCSPASFNLAFYTKPNETAYAKDANGKEGVTSLAEWVCNNGIKYIRFSFQKPELIGKTQMVTINSPIPTTYEPYFEGGDFLKGNLLDGVHGIRNPITVSINMSEEQIIRLMIKAYRKGNCDVYFQHGHYEFGEELMQLTKKYGMSVCEIPIGNGCRYYFNGSTLTGINATDDGDFYFNLLGEQRVPSDFELHDGILICIDGRYCVHDEADGLDGVYRHLYHNMRMEYRTNRRTEDIRKCIGGGTGKYGVVIIDGCHFTTDNTIQVDVSWHGNLESVGDSEFMITVKNSYFSDGFRMTQRQEGQTGSVMICNNSYTRLVMQTWDYTQFNNDRR